MSERLKQNFINQTAEIGIIGLGYVGLPLACEFGYAGFNVTGIDIDEKRVDLLNEGTNYISDVNDEKFSVLVKSGKFRASTDFSCIKNLDAISICVPTPLNKLKDPDVSYISKALSKISKYLHKDLLIVLESTTYPGTTREMVLPKLKSLEFEIGKDLFLCFSPERVDPGNKNYTISNTPKVIGGITKQCTALGQSLYSQIVNDVVSVSSPETAEMVKLLENTFRSINIGLANEVAIMCEKLGVDAWEVIDAASTKPFGFMKFTPGPGLGGHCIPVDPHYLAWKMRTLDYRARFIELASEVNTEMPQHIVNLASRGLNKHQKSIRGSKILLIGLAYKKDIDDVRESPSIDVMRILEHKGAQVYFYDPYVSQIKWGTEMKTGLDSLKELDTYDLAIILTDHSNVQYDFLSENCKLILDTRNVLKNNLKNNVIRLGVGDINKH